MKKETQASFSETRGRILIMAISMVTMISTAMGVMKTGNIVPRAGIEPTYLAVRASVQHYTAQAP